MIKMTKKAFILTMFLLILCSGIGIVSAETLTGDIGADEGWTSYEGGFTTDNSVTVYSGQYLSFNPIQNTAGIKSIIIWNNVSTHVWGWANGNTSGTCTFNITKGITGPEIGSGTLGYYRQFNQANPPVEQMHGYIWLMFDNFTPGSYTGDVTDTYIHFTSPLNNLWIFGYSGSGTWGSKGPVDIYIRNGGERAAATYTINYDYSFQNSYEITKPSGLGITGNITKRDPSQIYILDGSTNHVLSSDYTINSLTYAFNAPAQTVIIAAYSSSGTWFNSSVLFTQLPGSTPTPTPVPGATIAPGYIRTTVNIKDRSGAMIHGPNIQMKDIEGNIWSNSTSDADGIHYIDTLPGHVVSMYADYTIFSNEFLPGSLLVQPAGSTYYLTLYPYESGAGEGLTSLYVEVKEPSGSFIPYANVQITLPNGSSYSGSTANAGSKVFLVPNMTQIRATGTASGYLPATVVGNSGAGGSTTMTITLTRQVVTTAPTSTIPPGGVTPAVTIDTRSINQKDEDMMGLIRDAGPDLINLAIAVTMISLLGLMTKGFK